MRRADSCPLKPFAALVVAVATLVAAPAAIPQIASAGNATGAGPAYGGAVGLAGGGVAGSSRSPRIRLTVGPRRARVGRLIRFRFRARAPRDPAVAAPIRCRAAAGAADACAGGAGSARLTPVGGALVRFAGRRARTDRRGIAHIRVRLRRPRTYRATATAPDHRRGVARVRAVARRSSPAFTG